MSVRLGLGIGSGEVRAVIVRDGRVTWHAARAVAVDEPLRDAIATLLSGAPLPRFPGMPVIAALGPATAQVKRLDGLSVTTKGSVVSQLVRANAARFFLRNGIPLAATTAHLSEGSWWGAVMEAPTVAEVEHACERLPLRLEGFVPAISALSQLAQDARIEWQDGPVRASMTVRRGGWIDVRRDREPASSPLSIPAVSRLGPEGARYADAFSAACSSRRSPLFLRAAARRGSHARARALRVGLVVSASIALIAAIIAPGLAASRRLARDEARLEHLRDASIAWAPVANQLRHTDLALEQISRFAHDRRSAALLLGAISRALPDSTAIVNLRIDSIGGSLTLLSVSAASIIPRLAAIPSIAEPKIVGTVTRENVGGAQVQRIAVRFRLAGASPVTRPRP